MELMLFTLNTGTKVCSTPPPIDYITRISNFKKDIYEWLGMVFVSKSKIRVSKSII